MTNKYEAAIVLSVAQGEDATAALKEKFNDLIAKLESKGINMKS